MHARIRKMLISGLGSSGAGGENTAQSFWTYLELANVSGWEEEVK
jgi:hypothetical protein